MRSNNLSTIGGNVKPSGRMTMLDEPADKQEKIAHECKTTVLTVTNSRVHSSREVGKLVTGITGDSSARYDLLTTFAFRHLSPVELDVLAKDIETAVALHNGERLLLCGESSGNEIKEQLKVRLSGQVRDNLEIQVVRLPESVVDNLTMPKGIIISCMDFRLHGSGGLLNSTADEFGIDTTDFGLLATAGGAKELTSSSLRTRFVIDNMPVPVESIILLSHTDCGKYGGNNAFTSPQHQMDLLSADLAEARNMLQEAFPHADIGTGIVHVENDRVSCVKQLYTTF